MFYYRTEQTHDYAELPVQLQQQQTSTDQTNSNDGYSTINEWMSPDYALPIDNTAISQQAHHYTSPMDPKATTGHYYADLTRSKPSESPSISEQSQQVYSTVIRQDGKKVTVHFTVSDPSEQHQNENPLLANDKNDLANENITSGASSSNVAAPTGRDVQVRAIHSTVVRQDGEKITIRVQTPMEEQDSW